MNSLTNQNNFEITQLDLSVIDTMRNGNNHTSSLSDNSRNVYYTAGKQYNEYLQTTGQTVTGTSLKAFLQLNDWQPTTYNLKRQGLINIIENQQNIENKYILIAAIKEMFKKEVKRVKITQAITEDEYLTSEQIEELKTYANIKLSLMFDFLFQTGCRVSELIHIKIDDIKFNDVAKIKIVGKGNKQRIVYAKSDLVRYIIKEFSSKNYLFETRTGTKFNRKNLLRDIKNTGIKAGFKISPHTFRHSCAMHLKRHGKQADYIQKYLGHEDVSTTIKFYFHNKPNAEIVELF